MVWTIQTHLIKAIENEGLPYKVMNDHPILPGKRRSLSADIVILNSEPPDLVAEFKYEPAHRREDIPHSKFPVVFWSEGVLEDIKRINKFISKDCAGDKAVIVAYALFFDEGSYFRHKEPPVGSRWEDWDVSVIPPHQVSVLWSKAKQQSM